MAYSHRTWACPFFKWDERLCVHCENGGRISLPDRQAAKEYMDRYCASATGWKDCSFASSLLRYYERTDET